MSKSQFTIKTYENSMAFYLSYKKLEALNINIFLKVRKTQKLIKINHSKQQQKKKSLRKSI